MKYLKKLSDSEIVYPYTIIDLKRDFPNTSFPQNITEETLASFEVYSVQPTFETAEQFEELIEIAPTENAEGKWIQAFRKEPMILGKIEMLKDKEWVNVRLQRNIILKDSDFKMLEDFPQTDIQLAEWKTYRQALRDITLQADPFNIIWPTKPV